MTDRILTLFNTSTRQKQKRRAFFAAALALGTVFTLISWPGIFYADSYGRWFLARELSRFNFAVQDDWLSVPPQLFMAVLYKLTNSYGSFTLVQSVFFFFTAFCAVDFFCPRGGPAAGMIFALCPVFYGFSVYLEMSVICVCALLWLMMLLLGGAHQNVKDWKTSRKILYFVICFLLYFTMLGFRQNAFTVLPVAAFLLIALCRKVKSRLPAFLHAGALVLSLAVIFALPSVLNFGIRNGSGSASTGFLWETVSMLEYLQDDEEYKTMLDYLGEEGTTQKAVQDNNYTSIYGYHSHIPNVTIGQGGNAAQIRKDYFGLMFKEPAVYWKVKGEFMARTMGITQPLALTEYDYDRDGRMAEFGMQDTPRRQQFHQSYISFMQSVPVLRRPWAIFALAAALLILAGRALGKTARGRLWALYAAAGFFYASFLVTTQSQEFRYFFAPLVLLYLCMAGSAGALLGLLYDKFKVKRAGGSAKAKAEKPPETENKTESLPERKANT